MEWKKLGDIANYVSDSINSADIELRQYITTDCILQNKCGRTIATNLPPKRCSLTRYQKGDVLVANIRPYLKKIWLADGEGGASTDVLVLRAKQEYSKEFLYALLLQDCFFDYATRGAKGSKMPRGDKKQILTFPIPDIPIEEQRRIASVLSALDRKITLNRQMNATLEAMARQLYDYWFVQFDFPDQNGKPYKSSGGEMQWNEKLKRNVPKGWKIEKVENLVSPFERGLSYSSADIETGEGIAMMNLACFDKQGEYRSGQMKFYNGAHTDTNVVYPSDLLLACTDLTRKADIIGTPIFVPREYDKYVYSTDLAKMRCTAVGELYLYYSLKTPWYRKYIKPWASGTTVLHLNLMGINMYTLPVPPTHIDEAFTNAVSHIKGMQARNLKENLDLTSQRDALLPLLLNGQVSVQCPM